MVKATTPLSPRSVLGNRCRSLSLEEASAALLAMLSGAREILPRRSLQDIADSIGRRQEKATRHPPKAPPAQRRPSIPCAATPSEVSAAIAVWARLREDSPKQRKAHDQMMALQASLKTKEARNV
jgi:hypothetical protein